jgi:hypothetical protein
MTKIVLCVCVLENVRDFFLQRNFKNVFNPNWPEMDSIPDV